MKRVGLRGAVASAAFPAIRQRAGIDAFKGETAVVQGGELEHAHNMCILSLTGFGLSALTGAGLRSKTSPSPSPGR